MSGSLSLNGTWDLLFEERAPEYYTVPQLRGCRPLSVNVPAPIHWELVRLGLLDDPYYGINTLKARWVEEQFWIYRRDLQFPAEAASEYAWLVFERLELYATVWLNGEKVGTHANAHRPARFPVTGLLKEGVNRLVVLVESGLHATIDRNPHEYGPGDWHFLMTNRVWHRHPQYQAGWDWNPRLLNVGILGDVRLEWSRVPRLDQVAVFAVPSADLSSAVFTARAFVENPRSEPAQGILHAALIAPDGTRRAQSETVTLPPGESRQEMTFVQEKPRLWWPVGHGEQPLYTVEVALEVEGETQLRSRRTGVRRVEMDQSPHPVEGRYCILRINNRPIFCKGGNWVPPDMLYSRVTPERTRELVRLALEANFNTLRIWGGGLYADEALCSACDESGILIWHDLLFACGKYPGDEPEFTAEVRREVTYAVRELACHPALAVWCGNNEIEWGDWYWGYDDRARTHPHYALFHHDLPKIVLEEDPSKLYWISSPWSPDFRHPNDPTVGDQHPWNVSILQAGCADFWEYRRYVDRFPNEGGVLGASSPATLRQFLPERDRALFSPSWNHHDNPLALQDVVPGEIGHAYQTVRLWTGFDPMEMDWEEYAFLSALLHSEGLQEYIANYRRRMFSSASTIFWMYNDSWPVTHGWTIVDYYLRKKLSYHPVRRAFAPVTVVVAEEGEEVIVFGVNDTPRNWNGDLRCGLFGTAGRLYETQELSVKLPANTSTPLARISRAAWDRLGVTRAGAFAQLLHRGVPVAQHRMLRARFGELEWAQPQIICEVARGRLTLRSEAFVWGVCLDMDGEAPYSDNAFDLLPGLHYTIPWRAVWGKPKTIHTGNQAMLRDRKAAVR
jgi:beta-mannosidase